MSRIDDPFIEETEPRLPPPVRRVRSDATPRAIDPATDPLIPITQRSESGPERMRVEEMGAGPSSTGGTTLRRKPCFRAASLSRVRFPRPCLPNTKS